jgi:transcriptional regulator with XRE-family HTH domain
MAEARGSTGSPTVRRRELGATLRALRLDRGFTVDQVAEHLLCSPSKVSRMETGQRGATARDIRDLCELYGVSDAEERERLTVLARRGRQQGWWQSYSLPYQTFVGLEQEATSMTIYHSAVVPGLLQTGDYTRGIHEKGVPQLNGEEVEDRVKERATRQQLLTRENPPQVEVFLDQAVLQRPIGGAQVMRKQLDSILAAARLPNVRVQILPYEVGSHPALESNFIILAFDGEAPTVVYVEGLVGGLYLERPPEIERYLQVSEILRGLALSPKDSALLLENARDTYKDDEYRHD